MEIVDCIERRGLGDYFGDSDFRHMSFGEEWMAYIDNDGKLTVEASNYNPGGEFDYEEYEKHKITLVAEPTRNNWKMLNRISRTIIRFGTVKLFFGDKFLGEHCCDGSIITFS